MNRRRRLKWLLALLALAIVGVAISPWLIRTYWSIHSSNPVRRGVQRAGELGCFSCHGELGSAGIPDPGEKDHEVPAWSGGVWMMYVENDEAIRDYILNGSAGRHQAGPSEGHQHENLEIQMPAYRSVVRGSDLEDLTAAFKVLSGMSLPPAASPARRGFALARKWRCFSCHGPGGSGGLPNPGSFTGFIPGWYGPDFDDLVRDREEFDGWILDGTIPRLEFGAIASFFTSRQRLSMPAYEGTTAEELDDLWAYAQWLAMTGGGHEGVERSW